jgi:hypothetical protein
MDNADNNAMYDHILTFYQEQCEFTVIGGVNYANCNDELYGTFLNCTVIEFTENDMVVVGHIGQADIRDYVASGVLITLLSGSMAYLASMEAA